MSEALFSRVETELFPTAELIDLRGWGESLILREFPDRARRAAKSGAALRVVTNLSFRRDDVLDLLAEFGFYVGISLDSPDDRVLAQLRRGARLGLIERNLSYLVGAFRQHRTPDRLNLYVTCQRPALPGLEGIVELAARAGIDDIRLGPVGAGTSSPLCLQGAEALVREMLERMQPLAQRFGIRVSFTASLLEGMFPNLSNETCLHPWCYCYIAYDGKVGFCDHLIGPHAAPYIVGDLEEQSFEEIWNGPVWIALREEHLGQRRATSPRFEECAWCYRNRHLDFEDLLSPRLARFRSTLGPAKVAVLRGTRNASNAAH